MVQQIITLCDVCYDGGKTSPATGHVVTVAGGTWHLELCEAHRAALIYPLADVAERLGQAVKGEAAKAATSSSGGGNGGRNATAEPCLVCEHHAPTIAALLLHLRNKHATTIGAVYGTTCPLCAREFPNASALGGHVSRTHREVAATLGNASLPEAFRYAADRGDEHDVVAKVLASHGRTALPARVKS